jgi:hypothetical protein
MAFETLLAFTGAALCGGLAVCGWLANPRLFGHRVLASGMTGFRRIAAKLISAG